MKRLLLALFLLWPSVAFGAFASVGSLGALDSATDTDSIVVTLSAQCDAGNLCICSWSPSNNGTTDADHNEVTAVTDSTGKNTWTELDEWTNGQGNPGQGATQSSWYTIPGTSIPISGTITAQLAVTRPNRSAICWEFTVGTATINVAQTVTPLSDDAVQTPGSMATSSLPSKEYLHWRGISQEGSESITATAGWTMIQATGVTDQSRAHAEFIISTTTGVTSDPTGGGGVNRDWSSILVALEEVSAPATRRRAKGKVLE